MLDLIKKAVGAAVSVATKHPVIAGLGIASLVLPKILGMGTSPNAMMGAQTAIGNRIPPQGLPPQSPGSF